MGARAGMEAGWVVGFDEVGAGRGRAKVLHDISDVERLLPGTLDTIREWCAPRQHPAPWRSPAAHSGSAYRTPKSGIAISKLRISNPICPSSTPPSSPTPAAASGESARGHRAFELRGLPLQRERERERERERRHDPPTGGFRLSPADAPLRGVLPLSCLAPQVPDVQDPRRQAAQHLRARREVHAARLRPLRHPRDPQRLGPVRLPPPPVSPPTAADVLPLSAVRHGVSPLFPACGRFSESTIAGRFPGSAPISAAGGGPEPRADKVCACAAAGSCAATWRRRRSRSRPPR